MDENITERIKQIIEDYNLSSTLFADRINVNRASISQILSGRNKPSLNIIIKILDTFREVDTNWLLKGQGEFTTSTNPSENKSPQNKNSNLFSNENTAIEKVIEQNTNKQIEKITVFFTDGTFKDFI